MSDELQPDEIERRGRRLRERVTSLELRVDAADGKPGFSGYASTFWHVDSYGTAFAPGSWKRSIRDVGDHGVPVLWQHWPDMPIGRSLSLKEDKTGLAVVAMVSDQTQTGRESLALAREGIVRGLSVGFRTLEDRTATEDDPVVLDFAPEPLKDPKARNQIRIMTRSKLIEFSHVTFPSNEASDITAMRADAQVEALAMALDDLKAGRLDEDRLRIAEELALALRDRLERPRTPPPPAVAPQAVIALLQAQIAYLQSA